MIVVIDPKRRILHGLNAVLVHHRFDVQAVETAADAQRLIWANDPDTPIIDAVVVVGDVPGLITEVPTIKVSRRLKYPTTYVLERLEKLGIHLCTYDEIP